MKDAPEWGIEPVPEKLRLLGTLDGFLLWANLSVSLLVIVAGAFLVLPAAQGGLALSLPVALAAIAAAAVVGNVMLGLGGLIGADAGVPTMVLMRAPLGRRGSYLPTGLNILQCLGWSVFELIVIATGASALSQQVFGFGGTASGRSSSASFATVLALLGPVGFVRRYVRKFAVWIVIASLLYLSLVVAARPARRGALAAARLAGVLAGLRPRDRERRSRGRRSSPTTRASRRTRAAGFWGAGFGYFVPTIPLFALGAVIAMSRHISDASGAADGDRGRRRRERARAARADGRRERRGVRERLLGRRLAAEPAARRAPAAARRRHRGRRDRRCARSSTCATTSRSSTCSGRSSSRSSGCCSPTGSWPGATTAARTSSRRRRFRVGPLAAWLAGFCLYQWLYPEGPRWWTRLVAHTDPHALPVGRRLAPELRGGLRARRRWPGSSPAGRHRCRRTRDRAARQPLARLPARRAAAHRRRPVPRRPRAPAPRRARAHLRALRRRATAPSSCRRSRGSGRRCATSPGAATASFEIVLRGRPAADDDALARRHLAARPTCRRSTRRVRWVHVAPLARSDFPAETLAAAARGPAALARRPGPRPRRRDSARSVLDADFDPELLRHVWVLKLNDEEAEVIGDPLALGVRELLLTHGARGATVHADGRVDEVPAFPLEGDPTGAGDAFCVAYLAARSTRLRAGRRGPAGDRGRRRDAGGGDRARRDGRRHLRRRPRERRGRRRPTRSRPPRARRSTCRGWSPRPSPARPWSPSSMRGRRCSSPTTRARPGASRGAACRPASAVAVADWNPDVLLYASAQPPLPLAGRRRLLDGARGRAARDRGGRAQGILNSPRATSTAEPPTRTRSIRSAEPSATAKSLEGRPISAPCAISISSPKAIRPCRARWIASGPAAEPVAGSSATPWRGREHPGLPALAVAREAVDARGA